MSKKNQRLISQSPDSNRRDFLRGSMTVATGVAVTVATGQAITRVAENNAADEPAKKEGYRLTKHIADYYKTAAI